MVPRGSGCPGVHKGAPGRSGGVSIRCTIPVFARLLRRQGGMKREPASPGGPGGSQGTLLGVVWGSFRVNFASVEADLGSDLVVSSSN